MPQLDMPLAELRTYPGRNPRPSNFDSYWDAALAELDAHDPAVELIPASFQAPYAECLDLWFTGIGGSRIYAKLLRPRAAKAPGPALLRFHGYSGNSGNWTEHLAYVAAGFTVAAMDCRGQGGRSNDLGGAPGNTLRGHITRGLDGGPQSLLYRFIFLDTVLLARIVSQLDGVDPARLGAEGASQGGALTLACAALCPMVSRAYSVFPFLSDYLRVWEMDLAEAAYEDLRTYFRLFDPLHEREQEIFTTLGYIDVQHLAPRIRARTMMVTGLMDKMCPPSTQFAAYNKITAPKDVVIFPDYDHEKLPGVADMTFEFFAGL